MSRIALLLLVINYVYEDDCGMDGLTRPCYTLLRIYGSVKDCAANSP